MQHEGDYEDGDSLIKIVTQENGRLNIEIVRVQEQDGPEPEITVTHEHHVGASPSGRASMSVRDMLKTNEQVLNRYLTAFADIIGQAGDGKQAINSFDIRSPDLHPVRITWTREGERVHARQPPEATS